MKIHQIRNATIILESGSHRILVDPMLGAPATLPPYSVLRFPARKNPLCELPPGASGLLENISAGLITHTHFGMDSDHLDAEGARRLKGVPVYCNAVDAGGLRKRGLDPRPLVMGRPTGFFEGTITAVPASHGGCVMSKLMGPGAGYVIRLPGAPCLYLTGDTILTEEVRNVLAKERPDVCVLPCGSAQLDFGGPVLMPLEEIQEFVRLAPGRVVANHLEALNHCPTTRGSLRQTLRTAGFLDRVIIPADGEMVSL